MAAGMVAATLTHTAAAAGIAPVPAVLTWPGSDVSNSGALLAAVALLTLMGLARVAQSVRLGVNWGHRCQPVVHCCLRCCFTHA